MTRDGPAPPEVRETIDFTTSIFGEKNSDSLLLKIRAC